MIRRARPADPGQFIRMEVIEPLGLSVTQGLRPEGGHSPSHAEGLRGWRRPAMGKVGSAFKGSWGNNGKLNDPDALQSGLAPFHTCSTQRFAHETPFALFPSQIPVELY